MGLSALRAPTVGPSGPYAINGVPLRRVNQRYCIATSTKVDVKADNYKVNDDHFKRDAKKKGKKSEGGFFKESGESTGMPEEKKKAQKKMDEPLVKGITGDMKAYLKSRFSLTANMFPHELKF